MSFLISFLACFLAYMLSRVQVPQTAATPVMENKKRALKDITIRCLPEDSAHPVLGALRLAMFHRDDDDNVELERVSPTTWMCKRKINLELGMGEIVFVLLAEPAEGLGFVTLLEEDIEALIVVAEGIVLIERNVEPIELTCVSLSLEFTVEIEPTVSYIGTVHKQLEKSTGLPGGLDMFSNFNRSEDPHLLNSSGNQFLKRFEETGKEEDIDNAISAYELAIETMSTDDEEYGGYIVDAGRARFIRFEVFGNIHDSDRAVSNFQHAVKLTPPGHADLSSRLSCLVSSFGLRFERTEDLADLEGAISNAQRVVELTPPGHAGLPTGLDNLGKSFALRFGRTGDLADIERGISNGQRAVELTPPGDAALPLRLDNLGNSFVTRCKHTGDLADIESAISNKQRAVELTPPGDADLPFRLQNLGNSFGFRFEHTGDLADLENAISNAQRAVELTPPDHANLPSGLNNLGASFASRFKRTGDLADIERAISNQQRAVELTPPGHANLRLWLANLGASFGYRFRQTGDLVDIESAISNFQHAVELTPPDHADLPSGLYNLGVSFWSRFERTEDLTDLNSAISNQQRVVEVTPPDHANVPLWLNGLGVLFLARFNHTGNLTDIQSAISNSQRAIDLTPSSHPDLPSFLNNLGNSFLDRFECTEELPDIDSAISNFQRAHKLTPPGHADLPSGFNNLGSSFWSRFRRTGERADMESSISNLQDAVELTPPGHASLPSRLNNLGLSFLSRFKCTQSLEHFDQAISTYRSSATQIAGAPSKRLHAAETWARLSHAFRRSDTLEAFGVAIELLSHVAGLDQTVHKRHSNLVDRSNLTTFAAATAINAGKLGTALEWLEQGRCLVWNQIQLLRTPVDHLRAYDPTLADRFVKVGNALEASGSRHETSHVFSETTMGKAIGAQRESQMHVELAKEWTQLLEKIRALPDFQDFLRPPKAMSLLSGLPYDGAVVIFNIVEDRGDALALVSGADTPLHVPLPNFGSQQAVKLGNILRTYVQNVRGLDANRAMELGRASLVHIHNVLRGLWENVVEPVLTVLQYRSYRFRQYQETQISSRPRIWWCPTGPLAFLPIHAAGIYASDKSCAGPCVSDFVISSYIPTISSLIQRMRSVQHSSNGTSTRLLLVSQPSTPDLTPIPAAEIETGELQKMMEKENFESSLIKDEAATIARVKEEMVSCSWVHFACHGIQDVEPLKSGLHVHDGRLELLEMMKQRIEDTDHAFLSACQTGKGDEKLADEVVHLAAGMLAVGYRGVIGTMWSISDKHGPRIAQEFYQHLLDTTLKEGGDRRQLDSTRAAHALDSSIRKIRAELGDGERALAIWVPYAHFGI